MLTPGCGISQASRARHIWNGGPRESGALPDGNRTADVSWKLAAMTDTLTLHIVADPGPVTGTVVITGVGSITQTVAQPNFTGIELAVFENPPVDGSPQTRSVGLEHMPSGTYHVWFEADDKFSAPVRTYTPETIRVVQPWVNTWTAKLAAISSYRSLDVTWDPCPNPDADGYILYAGPAPGVISQTIDVSATLTTTVGGLAPNQLYYLWLDAADSETGKKSRSETIGGTPQNAPFDFSFSPASLTVEAGKTATATALFSTGVISYPEGISLYLDPLPDGLAFDYTSEIITPTIIGTLVSIAITTSETLPGGLYVLPLLAIGGDVTRTTSLSLTVTGPSFGVERVARHGHPAHKRKHEAVRWRHRLAGADEDREPWVGGRAGGPDSFVRSGRTATRRQHNADAPRFAIARARPTRRLADRRARSGHAAHAAGGVCGQARLRVGDQHAATGGSGGR